MGVGAWLETDPHRSQPKSPVTDRSQTRLRLRNGPETAKSISVGRFLPVAVSGASVAAFFVLTAKSANSLGNGAPGRARTFDPRLRRANSYDVSRCWLRSCRECHACVPRGSLGSLSGGAAHQRPTLPAPARLGNAFASICVPCQSNVAKFRAVHWPSVRRRPPAADNVRGAQGPSPTMGAVGEGRPGSLNRSSVNFRPR